MEDYKKYLLCMHGEIYYKCPLCSLKKTKYTHIEELLDEENKNTKV